MATQRRMIYAQLAENKDFALMSDKAQKTYIFLIVLADDDGRVKGDSDWLRIKVFPYNPEVTAEDMKSFLREIAKVELIILYKHKIDNSYYIQHPNWEKYQLLRSDRKKDSTIPSPDDNQVSTKRVHKRSNISKEEKKANTYLLSLPEKDLEEFEKRFDITKKSIISKAEDLYGWCKMNNKWKKDYKHFLLNALKKDFPERKEPLKKRRVAFTSDNRPYIVEE